MKKNYVFPTENNRLKHNSNSFSSLEHPDNEALAAWLAAKELVRAELPKPQKGGER